MNGAKVSVNVIELGYLMIDIVKMLSAHVIEVGYFYDWYSKGVMVSYRECFKVYL